MRKETILGYDQYHRTAFIPNEEIRQEFQTVLKEEKWDELHQMELASYELLEATLDMDVKEIGRSELVFDENVEKAGYGFCVKKAWKVYSM